MTRDIDTATDSALQETAIRVAILANLQTDPEINLWTGCGDVEIDGKTYIGAGNLLSFTDISENLDLTASGITVQLSGMPGYVTTQVLAEDIRGKVLELFLVVFDETGALVGDPVGLFKGKAQSSSCTIAENTLTISVAFISVLSFFNQVRERRFTPEDQKAVHPSDLGLDHLPIIQNRSIIWKDNGRK